MAPFQNLTRQHTGRLLRSMLERRTYRLLAGLGRTRESAATSALHSGPKWLLRATPLLSLPLFIFLARAGWLPEKLAAVSGHVLHATAALLRLEQLLSCLSALAGWAVLVVALYLIALAISLFRLGDRVLSGGD